VAPRVIEEVSSHVLARMPSSLCRMCRVVLHQQGGICGKASECQSCPIAPRRDMRLGWRQPQKELPLVGDPDVRHAAAQGCHGESCCAARLVAGACGLENSARQPAKIVREPPLQG